MKNNTLSFEKQQFIKNNVVGNTTQALTEMFNKKFNEDVSINTIRNYKKKNRLKSGINTKFSKNIKPWNYKKVGSEFVSSDGYTYIKVAEPNSWKHKQVYIYESNFGKIPENHSVVFGDGDKTNFDFNNLILVENKDKLTAKNKHLFYNNVETTKSGLILARLINKTSKLEKGVRYDKSNKNIK